LTGGHKTYVHVIHSRNDLNPASDAKKLSFKNFPDAVHPVVREHRINDDAIQRGKVRLELGDKQFVLFIRRKGQGFTVVTAIREESNSLPSPATLSFNARHPPVASVHTAAA
jgi:hypothetical protein